MIQEILIVPGISHMHPFAVLAERLYFVFKSSARGHCSMRSNKFAVLPDRIFGAEIGLDSRHGGDDRCEVGACDKRGVGVTDDERTPF
jgi:hypothetical protein